MTETTDADATWLTQEAYDRLREELDYLSGPGRTEISHKIEVARAEGDLSENGGYHAAKEEQGKREARIRQLTALLRSAQVGEPPVAAGVAGPGMLVEVEFSDGERERFLLGSREVGPAGEDVPVYSAQSPLGRALCGKKVGEQATYQLPSGRSMTATVLSAEPFTG